MTTTRRRRSWRVVYRNEIRHLVGIETALKPLRDNHDAGDFLQLFPDPVENDFGGITGGIVVRMGAVTRTEQFFIAEPKVEIVQYELCDLLVESLELFASHS